MMKQFKNIVGLILGLCCALSICGLVVIYPLSKATEQRSLSSVVTDELVESFEGYMAHAIEQSLFENGITATIDNDCFDDESVRAYLIASLNDEEVQFEFDQDKVREAIIKVYDEKNWIVTDENVDSYLKAVEEYCVNASNVSLMKTISEYAEKAHDNYIYPVLKILLIISPVLLILTALLDLYHCASALIASSVINLIGSFIIFSGALKKITVGYMNESLYNFFQNYITIFSNTYLTLLAIECVVTIVFVVVTIMLKKKSKSHKTIE